MKKGVFTTVAGVFLLFFFCSLAVVSLASVVSAQKDVGYILLNTRSANPQVVSIFNELNLTYDLLLDSKTSTWKNSLSNYRFLFIDDVRLNNARNLPIYNYPSVIMNRYYGPNWGLTDRDGISQMASSSSLTVKIVNNGFAQVYTSSRYSLGGSFIPIYYLSDENKVSGTDVARAFEGGGDSFNTPLEYGDVIEGVPAGTLLKNNKISNANMCFYGIAKTGFWTNDAKRLFLDCVGYVSSKCSSDSDCPSQTSGARYCMAINAPYNNSVYQNTEDFTCVNPGQVNSQCVDEIIPANIENCTDICVNGACVDVECMNDAECDDLNGYTADKCVNPATVSSHCTHTPIICKNDLDCGTNGFTGDSFCSGNNKNVLRSYLTFTCNNAGETSSYCTNSTSQMNIQNCSDTCVGGVCKSITCYKDSDCDDLNVSTEDKCLNPGTLDSSCKNQPIVCFDNSDCGNDGWQDGLFCVGKNLSRNFMSYMCNNPGTSSSFCTSSTAVLINQTCADACVNGKCEEIECYKDSDCDDGNVLTEDKCLNPGTVQSQCTHNPIACFSNLDCGTNTLSGNLCSGNDIIRNFMNYTCLNAGQANSYCGSFSGSSIVQTCSQQCQAGKCTVINCTQDLDCDDADARTIDSCVNPNTTASYCRNNEVNCLNNLDCGFTGFMGTEFCALDDVYKYYKNSTCINPGTLDSNCVVSQFPIIVQDCEDNKANTVDTCVDNNPAYCKHDLIQCYNNSQCSGAGVIDQYCVGKDLWNNVSLGNCLNPGTAGSSCSLTHIQVLNQTCSDYCSNGKCENFKCKSDLECGIDVYTENFCSSDDLYRNYLSFTCNNPWTAGSFCSNSTQLQLVEDCGDDSYSDYGENYCKGNDVYKSRAFYNRGCSSSLCFVYAVTQEVNVENCSDVCVSGKCEKITCDNNLDCGNNFYSNDFCSDKNVSKNYTSFMCNNPGAVNSYCTNSTITITNKTCSDYCSNGECGNFKCKSDSDCGNPFYSDLLCMGKDLTRNLTTPTCNNPNTILSYCVNITSTLLNKTCEFGCSNANCNSGEHDVAILNGVRLEYLNGTVVYGIINCENEYNVIINVSNLGNYYENVTFHGNVGGLLYVNHPDIKNFAPGASVLLYKKVKLDLNPGFYNISINATIPVDNVPENNYATRQLEIRCPECSSNADCPGAGWKDFPFCSGFNVNQTYTEVSCVNPGELSSYCTSFDFSKRVGSCLFGCLNGGCTC